MPSFYCLLAPAGRNGRQTVSAARVNRLVIFAPHLVRRNGKSATLKTYFKKSPQRQVGEGVKRSHAGAPPAATYFAPECQAVPPGPERDPPGNLPS